MEIDAMLLRVAMGWLVSAGALGAQVVQRVAVHVGTDATAQYRSVESAVEALPAEGGLVLVAPGTYRERVWVKQSHVTIASANKDASKTRIVFDLSQGTQKEANSPIPGMATVTVTGDDFHAENITFENDFNRTHEQVSAGSQAQALNLTGDRNVLRNVRILGNQDTLYIGAKGCGQAKTNDCTTTRTYIDHSYISGNVDFIYGDAVAYFEGCEVHSTKHAGGYLTAQSKHYAGQDSVFVFDHTLLGVADRKSEGLSSSQVVSGTKCRRLRCVERSFATTWAGGEACKGDGMIELSEAESDAEKMAFNARAKASMQEYLRSKTWEEKVASIERMNAASKSAREAMKKAMATQPSSSTRSEH